MFERLFHGGGRPRRTTSLDELQAVSLAGMAASATLPKVDSEHVMQSDFLIAAALACRAQDIQGHAAVKQRQRDQESLATLMQLVQGHTHLPHLVSKLPTSACHPLSPSCGNASMHCFSADRSTCQVSSRLVLTDWCLNQNSV